MTTIKINVLSSVFFIIGNFTFAQIGIQTENPQALLHIDGAKDNPSTGVPAAAQIANDVIINSAGNVGIGTISPNAKLEINSGTSSTAGLRFSQLNAASPITSGNVSTLGVNNSGDLVIVSRLHSNGVNCVPEYALATGNDIVYTTASGNLTELTNVTTSGITHSNGVFTLKAGNTYRLEAALYVTGTNVGKWYNYSWYNVTAGTDLVNQNVPRSNSNTVGVDGSQPRSAAIFRPTVDTQVALRITRTSVGGGTEAGFNGLYSYILINQTNQCNR